MLIQAKLPFISGNAQNPELAIVNVFVKKHQQLLVRDCAKPELNSILSFLYESPCGFKVLSNGIITLDNLFGYVL